MAITSLNNRELLRKSKRNGSMGRDWISKLPDELLCKILSCLSTKNSVRTSLLSRRWRNLWTAVSTLDLKTRNFEDDEDFWDFFDGFMESNKDLDLTRFKLLYNIGEHTHKNFVSSIDEVVKRKVCHLTFLNIGGVENDFVRMPLSLYSCATLVNLELYSVLFDAPGSALVYLPCVKTMTLKGVMFDGDQVLTFFIARCPVLEELVMVTHPGEQPQVIHVRSRSLKSFKLESTRGEDCDEDEHPGDPKLVIFAPRLEYMSVCDYQTDSCIIRKIGASAKVEIDLVLNVDYDDPSDITMMRNFLTSISTVGEMIISGRSLEMIDDYRELEPLPQFPNLSWLNAFSLDNSWEELQTFLGYCPNLYSLELDFKCLPEPEAINISYVPQCFLSSLEYVELRTVGKASDKKVATYFQSNCVVLKELRLLETAWTRS